MDGRRVNPEAVDGDPVSRRFLGVVPVHPTRNVPLGICTVTGCGRSVRNDGMAVRRSICSSLGVRNHSGTGATSTKLSIKGGSSGAQVQRRTLIYVSKIHLLATVGKRCWDPSRSTRRSRRSARGQLGKSAARQERQVFPTRADIRFTSEMCQERLFPGSVLCPGKTLLAHSVV